MQVKSLQMSRHKNQIKVKIEPQLSTTGQLAGYSQPQSKTEIFKTMVKIKDGTFELLDPCPQKRLFLKLGVGSQEYFGSSRHLALPHLSNLRDIGGYQGPYGMIKWGYLYRSDALNDLTSSEVTFLKTLKIGTVIDLRSAAEIRRNPDVPIGEKFHEEIDPKAFIAAQASKIPDPQKYDEKRVMELQQLAQSSDGVATLNKMQNQMIIQMQDMVAKQASQQAYQRFLKMILMADGPVIFHCQGGKDRTGWASALLLGLLGIDRETIMEDYLLTKKYNQSRNLKRMAAYQKYTNNKLVLNYLRSLQLAKTAYLNAALETLTEISGSFEQYAREKLKFSDDNIQQLRQKYLIRNI